MSPLPTRAHVLETLFQRWAPIAGSETIPTIQALGRVPVQDLYAQVSIPVVRAAAMDGVAVTSSRFCAGIPDMSHWKLGETSTAPTPATTLTTALTRSSPLSRWSSRPKEGSGSMTSPRSNPETGSGPAAAPYGKGSFWSQNTGSCAPLTWPAWPWAA